MARQHGQQQREAVAVEAARQAARHGQLRRRDERLHVERERPRALDRDQRARARPLEVGAVVQPARVGHGHEAAPVISKMPTSSVAPKRFFCARRTRTARSASPSNISTDVDEVLEHARAGDRALLGHVADEHDRVPRALATRRSREAASRTCATEPGAEPISSAQSVCTESTTQTSGASASMVAQTASSRSRRARARPRSSPAARRAAAPAPATPRPTRAARGVSGRAREHRRVRLDLPTPGSPPSSTSEPGTSPPPSTRSSSAMPVEAVGRRQLDGREVDRPRGRRPPRAARRPAHRRVGARSSTSVDQASQPGHWPSQRGSLRPQSEQVKTVRAGLLTGGSDFSQRPGHRTCRAVPAACRKLAHS